MSLPVLDVDDKSSLSAGEAARELGVSSRTLRRLCSTGQIASFRTPGGQIRVWRNHLDAFLQGSPSKSASVRSPLDSKREDLQSLTLEIRERRLRRDLQKLENEEAEAERQRASSISAEELRNRAALEESRVRREELEEQRAEERRQQEADEEWQQWADAWLQFALKSLPTGVPREFVLRVQHSVEEALRTAGPARPRTIVEHLVLVAVEKAIEPWKRQLEIEKAIKQATQELPFEVRTFSDWFPPTAWEARATAAARQAITQLAPNVSLSELRAVAVNAGRQIASEYLSEQAREQARVREEQTRQRNASNKPFLVSMGVAEVSSYLQKLHFADEIFDEDLERKNELEQAVRIALEERFTGRESLMDAQRVAREIVDHELT
jgi:excisionase family DNA binding protein